VFPERRNFFFKNDLPSRRFSLLPSPAITLGESKTFSPKRLIFRNAAFIIESGVEAFGVRRVSFVLV
jgi:hypothetical protein